MKSEENAAMDAYNNGDYEYARELFEACLDKSPDNQSCLFHLGLTNQQLDLYDEAKHCYLSVIENQPDHWQALSNLAVIEFDNRDSEKAIQYLEKALEVEPENVSLLCNLTFLLFKTGQNEKSIEQWASIISSHEVDTSSYSNFLWSLHSIDSVSPTDISDFHKKWKQHLVSNDDQWKDRQYPNEINSSRRLKIAYVSADFRYHSVAYFIIPILTNHSTAQFETYCYCNNPHDNLTTHIQNLADNWRDILNKSDDEVEKIIEADEIDILIDLSGHTVKNRLTLFARKPAPIQMTYLGYPDTTGLDQIDYRITDTASDPDPEADVYYTEKLIRLANGFLCYQAPVDSPDITSLPYQRNGYITFGCFNNLSKITEGIIKLWSIILISVSDSKLHLKSRGFDDPLIKNRFVELFQLHKIPQERLIFSDITPGIKDHLAQYNEVDIALDTSPYNGTTTTCEALWMGVPVVTITGDSHASRVGYSLMKNNQLDDLIAYSLEDYVKIAINLSANIELLNHLRNNLRPHIQHSNLCNANQFIQNLENAMRSAWQTYCLNKMN